MRPEAKDVAAVVMHDVATGQNKSDSKAIEALVESGVINTWASANLDKTSETLLLESFTAAVDHAGTNGFDQQALQEILRTGLATYFYHRKAVREAREANPNVVIGSVFKVRTSLIKMIEDGIARDHRNQRIREDVATAGFTIDNSVIEFYRKYIKDKVQGDFMANYFELVRAQGLRNDD